MILLARALGFCGILIVYVALEWLNWEQAGKLALLGVLALLAVSAGTTRHGHETKIGQFMVLATLSPFLWLMGFHAFLREYFGVAADENLVTSALFGTDQAEAGEFVQQYGRSIFKHVGLVLFLTALATLAVRRWPGSAARTAKPRTALAAAVFLGLFLLVHLNPSMRKQDPLLYFPVRYFKWKKDIANLRDLQNQLSATLQDPQLSSLRLLDESPRTVVFALGESVTRLNFSYAGYPRQTTPKLSAMGNELIWFSDVVSSDGTTVPALEKILTPATLAQPDEWRQKPDVLTMAKKAGYKTFWISNHSTDMNGEISIFVSHADQAVQVNRGSSRGEGSYDEKVFPALADALRDTAPRKLIILHLLQAHPAYFYRYPQAFAHFTDTDDAVMAKMKKDGRAFWAIKMRNYYDNALLYADYVLHHSLKLCRESGQPVAWLYAPDHGQDVAHYNNFSGHNLRVRSQYEIPMIYWQSQNFPTTHTNGTTLSHRPYQTDVLDHTLLGLMGISGDYYDPRRDIFSDRFEPIPRTVCNLPYP